MRRYRLLQPVILGLLVGATVACAIYLLVNLSDTQQALRHNIQNQLQNRVRNVHSWCIGINDTRKVEIAVLARFHVQFPVSLLDCPAIEKKTLRSAK